MRSLCFGWFITRRIHPLAVRFPAGESGIDRAKFARVSVTAFDGEITPSIRPYFVPTASTLRSGTAITASRGS